MIQIWQYEELVAVTHTLQQAKELCSKKNIENPVFVKVVD